MVSLLMTVYGWTHSEFFTINKVRTVFFPIPTNCLAVQFLASSHFIIHGHAYNNSGFYLCCIPLLRGAFVSNCYIAILFYLSARSSLSSLFLARESSLFPKSLAILGTSLPDFILWSAPNPLTIYLPTWIWQSPEGHGSGLRDWISDFTHCYCVHWWIDGQLWTVSGISHKLSYSVFSLDRFFAQFSPQFDSEEYLNYQWRTQLCHYKQASMCREHHPCSSRRLSYKCISLIFQSILCHA